MITIILKLYFYFKKLRYKNYLVFIKFSYLTFLIQNFGIEKAKIKVIE